MMSQRFRQQRACPPARLRRPIIRTRARMRLFVATLKIGFLRLVGILKQDDSLMKKSGY